MSHSFPDDYDQPEARSGHVAFAVGGKMLIWGGFGLFCLDMVSGLWRDTGAVGDVPQHRDKFVSWYYEGRMIMFGGYGPEIRNVAEDSWVHDPGSWDPLNMRGWNSETFEYNIQHNTWKRLTTQGSTPCPRASHAGAVVGNRGFLFGGRFQERRRNDIHFLNLDTYTWSGSLPVVGVAPEGRSWHSLTPVGPSHLLLCGGFNTECLPLDDIWLFDTDSFLWSKVDYPLPTPRLWHTTVPGEYLGEVVVFGGCINNILSPGGIHTNTVLHIAVTAKPLLRLCIDLIRKYADGLGTQIAELPNSLKQRVLEVDNRHSSGAAGS